MEPRELPAPSAASPLVRLAIEGGPLLAFFLGNAWGGIYRGTAVFMVAIVLALAASWRIERRLPLMPLVTAVFVLVFGGLTLYFAEERFIKLKPTIVNLLFAVTLFVGLLCKRLLLKHLLGTSLAMDDRGWAILTRRWALFFVFLAALNEIVWRTVSTDAWVSFKTFGILPLSLVFLLSQMRMIQRHAIASAPGEPPAPE
jgi:intracellular septation protein